MAGMWSLVICPLVFGAHVLHVSPSSSPRAVDRPLGSHQNPFDHIPTAIHAVRALRQHETGPIDVLIEAGTYASFTLSSSDSGFDETGRTTYRGIGEVVISGGREVPPALFQPTPSPSANPAYVADLTSLNLPLNAFGKIEAGGCVDSCSHDRAEVFFHGEPMILARWPNVIDGAYQYQNADIGVVGGIVLNTTRVPDFKRILGWKSEPEGWLHGYWEWDWADCYRQIQQITPNGSDFINVMFSPADQTPVKNARFYGVNLLSELDAPGEYYLDVRPSFKQQLFFIPPEGSGPPSQWVSGPVLSLNESGVNVSGTSFVSLDKLTIVESKGTGILADSVRGLRVTGCNVMLHGQDGIHMYSALNSSVENSIVQAVGCAGIRAHGGNAADLTRGNIVVSNNTIFDFARWKRTYQAGIHWSGVGNVYSHNRISDAPHTCILGGGNEADVSSFGGVDCQFDSNTVTNCVYEGSDAGAFYTCGQSGTAFMNRNNTISNSVFTNIHGLRGGAQAIYLDDQMSGWTIVENRFVDCSVGTFIGGGRDNVIMRNYYENCSTTAQHIDNRGMNWQQTSCNCTDVCEPYSCICNPGAATWMVTKSPAAKQWASRFPTMVNIDHVCLPAHNIIQDNIFCKCKSFIDATLNQTSSWFTIVQNNTEVHSC